MNDISSRATVLMSYIILITDACNRNTENPEYTTGSSTNQTVLTKNHRLTCSENETQIVACLNGGTCFATDIGERTTQCACTRKYIGYRCQMIDPNIIYKGVTADMVGLISISIVVLIVLVIVIIIYKRKACCLKKENIHQSHETEPMNGNLEEVNHE